MILEMEKMQKIAGIDIKEEAKVSKQTDVVDWIDAKLMEIEDFNPYSGAFKVFREAKKIFEDQIIAAYKAQVYGKSAEQYYKDTYGG